MKLGDGEQGPPMETLRVETLEREYEAVRSLAKVALDAAHQHHLPPTPTVFEVFFEYAADPNCPVRASVDSLTGTADSLNMATIERIYEEHLSNRGPGQEVMQIGTRLDTQLGQIAELVETRIGQDQDFIGKLDQAGKGFSLFARSRDMGEQIRNLAEESRAHVARTTLFSNELERSRREIEALRKELADLQNSVNLDHLTGIANRRRLDEVLAAEVKAAQAGRGPLCLAIADLDKFKGINDTFGHTVGDAILRQFAQLLRQNVKGQDTPARFGGEEFAVVFPTTALLGARHISEQIRQKLYAKAFVLSTSRQPIGHVSVSIGVTQLRPDDTVDTLIDRADKLLYKAKEGGRNQVVSAD